MNIGRNMKKRPKIGPVCGKYEKHAMFGELFSKNATGIDRLLMFAAERMKKSHLFAVDKEF